MAKIRIYNHKTGESKLIDDSEQSKYGIGVPQPQPQAPPQVQQQPQAPQEQPSVGGFAGNVVKSGGNAIKDLLSAAVNTLNPNMEQNTIANLGRLGLDTVKAGGDILTGQQVPDDNRAKLVGNFYKQRYGGVDNIKNTLYNDPVGAAFDASAILGGGGALLKGAGELSKVSQLAKAGELAARTGELVDPLRAISGATKAVGRATGVTEKVGNASRSAADFLATKSARFSPSQLDKFQELVGQDAGRWMNENKVYTKADAAKAINPLQESYNSMTRTGAEIPKETYVTNLRQRAMDILDKDNSPAARQIAEKIWNEADAQERIGNTTDTVLTNTKGSEFNKVPAGAMADPIAQNFNKELGGVGIQTLDKVAPGSAHIGKTLEALRSFEENAGRQQQLGRGSLLLHALKPAVTGAAAGSFIPGLGNIGGALVGGTGAAIASHPSTLRAAAKVLNQGITVSPKVSAIAQAVGNISKAGRMNANNQSGASLALPPGQTQDQTVPDQTGAPTQQIGISQNQGQTYGSNVPQDNQYVNIGGPNGQKISIAEMKQRLAGGGEQQPQSGLEQAQARINTAIQGAAAAGDYKALSKLSQLNDLLLSQQQTQQKLSDVPAKKPLSVGAESKVQLGKSGLRALDSLEGMIKNNPEKIWQNAIPGQLGARDYDAAAYKSVEALLRARSGAAVPPEEVKRYMNANLPRIGDQPADIKFKLKLFRQDLEDLRNTGGSDPLAELGLQ